MTTIRTRMSMYFIGLIFIVPELWQIWRGSNREVNWWIALDYLISIQWWFKDLGVNVKCLIYAYVIYRITFKIQVLRTVAIIALIYEGVNVLFFFINYCRAPFALVYSMIGLVAMIVINRDVIWEDIKTVFGKTFNFFYKLFNKNHQHA